MVAAAGSDPDLAQYARIAAAIARAGLACRGALYPDDPVHGRTLVLVGFAGDVGWQAFAASPEVGDGLPDPLDRWSRRIVWALAVELGATALFPFDGPPFHPFQRWAQQAEPVFPSPIGLLIHPDWGLWHSYRGALAFTERLPLPPAAFQASPCETCADKPCLTSCPVGAFSPVGYDVAACADHLAAEAGRPCMESGCRARVACPVGERYAYGSERTAFMTSAFRRSVEKHEGRPRVLTSPRRGEVGARERSG